MDEEHLKTLEGCRRIEEISQLSRNRSLRKFKNSQLIKVNFNLQTKKNFTIHKLLILF